MKNKDIKETQVHNTMISAPEQSKQTKKKRKHAGGRPTVMTETVLTKLEQAFSYNFNDIQACLYADISTRTLARYEAENPQFCLRKDALRNQPKMAAKQTIVRKLSSRKIKTLDSNGNLIEIDQEGDADLALKYLERTEPESYSTKQTVKHEGAVEITDNREVADALQDIYKKIDGSTKDSTNSENSE